MVAKKQKINIGVLVAIFVAIFIGANIFNPPKGKNEVESQHHELQEQALLNGQQHHTRSTDDTQKIAQAFSAQQNDVQVQASGRVIKVLSDDSDGSRHQRFILDLNNGQSILIAHNIDLAARIENLNKGDEVEFYGVYEYNPQGGVVHWTHHDPQGQHIGGWLKHQGRTYQ